jgi:hypothetical protein
MAIINQSPPAQISTSLSNLRVDSIIASGTPVWQSRKIVGSPSIEVTLGNTGAPSLPTTGQIWPPGIPVSDFSTLTLTYIDPVIYSMIFS